MLEQRSGSEDTFEHIDADAVCEQCSTVNPAGTLLCKTCGNNLRDQRMRRLAADEGMDVVHISDRPRRVLTGLLVVFGLLAVVWAAINVYNGNIEEWLTRRISTTQTPESINPDRFWSGGDASLYDAMAAELRENPVTDEEAALTSPAADVSEGLDGRYVIRSSDGSRIVGSALVRTQGDAVYFVAELGRAVELRGRVPAGNDEQYEAEQVGVAWGNSVLDAYGVARPQPDGTYLCAGMVSNANNQTYTASAFKVTPAP